MTVDRGGAALCALLLAGNLALGGLLLRERPTHDTLPLFVPVSLEYERALQAGHKGTGHGGEEATTVAKLLSEMTLDDATKAAIAPHVQALAEARQRVLALRNERHQLNVALMQVGAALGTTLTAAQWDIVQRGRDAVRAKDDAAVFERLRGQLAPPGG